MNFVHWIGSVSLSPGNSLSACFPQPHRPVFVCVAAGTGSAAFVRTCAKSGAGACRSAKSRPRHPAAKALAASGSGGGNDLVFCACTFSVRLCMVDQFRHIGSGAGRDGTSIPERERAPGRNLCVPGTPGSNAESPGRSNRTFRMGRAQLCRGLSFCGVYTDGRAADPAATGANRLVFGGGCRDRADPGGKRIFTGRAGSKPCTFWELKSPWGKKRFCPMHKSRKTGNRLF